MVDILHDLIYQNPRKYGNIVYIKWRGTWVIVLSEAALESSTV